MRSLLTLLLLLSLTATAQEQDNGDALSEDPSRETDVSEDNYRRFMELRDLRVERPAFPSATLSQASGPQKLTALPEASQRHLRDQLRSIILESGLWTPEAMDQDYRYTPSQGARRNPALQQEEAEAWEELVAAYHAREAAEFAAQQEAMTALTSAAVDQPGDASEPAQPQSGAPSAATAAPRMGAPPGSGHAPAGGAEGAAGGAQGGGQASTSGTPQQQAEAEARQRELERILEAPAPQPLPRPERRPDSGVSQSAAAFLAERGYQTKGAKVPQRDADQDMERRGNRWQVTPLEQSQPRRITIPGATSEPRPSEQAPPAAPAQGELAGPDPVPGHEATDEDQATESSPEDP